MNEEVTYQYGLMRKDPRTMTKDEFTHWQKHCVEVAKAYLFSIGQPLVYTREDGHTVAEYEDGSLILVR